MQPDYLPAEPPGKPKNIGVGTCSLLQGSFLTQGWEPRSAALQPDSLPAEPPGKPPHLILVHCLDFFFLPVSLLPGPFVVVQWCPVLCSPMDGSPARLLCPWGFSQARRLEWVAMSSSRGIFPTQGSNLPLLHGQADSITEPPREPGLSWARCCAVLDCDAGLGGSLLSNSVPNASLSTPRSLFFNWIARRPSLYTSP